MAASIIHQGLKQELGVDFNEYLALDIIRKAGNHQKSHWVPDVDTGIAKILHLEHKECTTLLEKLESMGFIESKKTLFRVTHKYMDAYRRFGL